MSNEVITHKHEWVRGLFSELDRIAKDAATMADENQPLLGGEHYLTDRELPSTHDDRLTRQVQEAARLLNIGLLDHVIFTDGGYYSYADEGKL